MKQEVLKPAFKEKNIAIAIASSNEYAPLLGVLLESIVENATITNNYDIIILSKEISEANKRLLLSEIANKKNFSMRFFDITGYLKKYKFHTAYHITIMTYCRLALVDILKYYDKAIYLDCDVIINHDIAELYNHNLGENMIAAAIDTVMAGLDNSANLCKYRKEQLDYNINVLGIKNVFKYFNAGIIVMNLKEFRKKYSATDLLTLAASKKWKWFDQDVLNKICYGKVKIIEQSWNFMCHRLDQEGDSTEKLAPKEIYEQYCLARINPKALHFCGRTTPCFAPLADNAHYFWKYARNTPFYEILIYKMIVESSTAISIWYSDNWIIRKLKSIVKVFFPFGTNRYAFLKKIYFKLFNKER